ncbi:RNA polymerase factor sigma-54 [Alkaliphilus peptidifermentans]|uniref:RNA polymerase, sigma 54 subunit, RpoN/SigL n=1 Tax=Alkaliphilus peptidifermentans DSM 18978 TaxID=1120976 RepID=A0A1G5KST4_9FIRM|nr:RNA polymerase factor sigma-54 [Alkaliphilus peptidifermentans]SCZ03662.1 RNA polymerase, sigma 54 subunit, RpoN/SigL [Alkaliphilus peptidifermentans DSM 18978]
MRMGFSLQLEQSQKLIMTPQLQQAIKILQLTSLELDQFIQSQLETNPFLDINEEPQPENEKIDQHPKKEVDWKEYTDDYDKSYEYSGQRYNAENDFNFENIVSEKASLQDYLLNQLHFTFLNKKHRAIGEYLINSLDENGYLTLSLNEVAEVFNDKIDIVENILKIIQTFEPPGIAARDLKECLLIQLNYLGVTCKNAYKVIEHHLEDIAANKYPLVAKKLNISVEDVQSICDFIRTLEPKPGRNFSSDNNNYIVPDAVVKKINDEYYIVINDYNSPRLIIRDDYRKMLANHENNETVKFINDKLNAATWLIRSIEQRRQTIYKVIEVIVDRQKSFFDHGKKHLKPMTLKEVADIIEVHESTVSRATTGKYIETPVGTFELKYFFSSGIEGSDGEGVSSESIKSFIRDIIDKENTKKPLSDNKIADILTEQGMPISRRTVAKYRDDLMIPASSKRKRY